MKNNIEIFCTLGPASLNKKFLVFSNKKIHLLRINMSHIQINKLKPMIKFIKKYSSVPICIDTEGAQIRTKVKFKKKYLINKTILLSKNKGFFRLYPSYVFDQLKVGDLLEIGFEGLEAKVQSVKKNFAKLISTNSGILETNKGVNIKNRNLKLNFLTEKDHKAIEIAKKLKVKNFALSFTNTKQDIINFNKLLKNSKKIYKIETQEGLKNFRSLNNYANHFLIDRGDLSKSISIELIPIAQRYLFKKKTKKTKIAIATNFLESMVEKPFPTRAEANDIYTSIEMGANGLVLAGETAIGKYPIECVNFLIKVIKIFKKKKLNFK